MVEDSPPDYKGDKAVNAESRAPSNPFIRVMMKLWSEISAKVIIAASIFILSYGALIWTGFTSFIKNYLNEQILAIVTQDIQDKEKSKIYPAMLQRFSDIGDTAFQSRVKAVVDLALRQDVGALTTGQFDLNPASPSNTIQVFSPPDHNAKMFIQADGLGREQRIILLTSSGQRRSLPNSGIFEIDLSDLLKTPPDVQTQLTQGASGKDEDNPPAATQEQSYFRHVHSLTFQLLSSGSRKLPTVSLERVNVRYISFTTPLIELESK